MKNSPLSAPPIQMLVNLLHGGQFEQLAHEAKACAARWPASGPIWHLLGLAHLNMSNPEAACAPLAKAAKLTPNAPDIAEQLAIAYLQSGHLKEAYRSFERCLILAPGNPNIVINLAHLACELNDYRAAERHCRNALRQNPKQPEALYNLGRALRGQKQLPEAIAAFRDALSESANSAVAQNDIGLQLHDLNALEEAEACFRRAIALNPSYAQAHSNLGRVLESQGKLSQAIAACQCAIRLEPGLAAAHGNLAGLYNALHNYPEAEAESKLALAIDPKLAMAYNNLGAALMRQMRFLQAERCYQNALNIDQTLDGARINLGNLYQAMKRFDEAEACYRKLPNNPCALGDAYHCASQLSDWSRRTKDESRLSEILRSTDNSPIGPFGLLCLGVEEAPLLQRLAGLKYANGTQGTYLTKLPLVSPDAHPRHERLRIGYLSADFHDHATMHLLAGVLANHDKQRFAIHLYSYGPNREDRERQHARACADIFCDFSTASDIEAAAQIAADGIDLLIDLKGYTQDTRLGITAQRPSPVIISWLGYPGTLGHERLADYIIGDPVVTPPEHAEHFSETLALMPDCYQPNDRLREIGPRPTRTEAGLPEQGIVICSFNQTYKITPQVFEQWCGILADTPGSVLWLLETLPAAMNNLRREAKRYGITAERLIFAPKKPLREHLGRLQLADLALDTAPYGSHTTGSDALWAGVPLVTQLGGTFASRVGASLLRSTELPELITNTWEDYRALATSLAHAPGRLEGLRARLIEHRNKVPLFDTEKFTRNLEALYERIWEQHAQGIKAILLPH